MIATDAIVATRSEMTTSKTVNSVIFLLMDFINEPRFCTRFVGYIFIVILIIPLPNKKGNITDAFSSFVTKTPSLFSSVA